MPFRDRRDAGRRLAKRLRDLQDDQPVVLGLPRGGIPVAYEIARALAAPLDVLVVRKLGCPWQPELGVGAIGEGGIRVLNEDLVARLRIRDDDLAAVTERETDELERRVHRYRDGRQPVPIEGRTVVVVDDGLATGFTARAAIGVLRERGARRIVLAVPVAPAHTCEELSGVADEVVCVETPATFRAIGSWYADFHQVPDDEVTALLADAIGSDSDAVVGSADAPCGGEPARHEAQVRDGEVVLPGALVVPPSPTGVVLFAHGSGSSRLSPRNVRVAEGLHDAGLATLLFDLLTDAEAADRANVFDVPLLGRRLLAAHAWVDAQPAVAGLPVGYFGASTGAAAALWAAADRADTVAAVVSRGGRPDLAGPRLPEVTAATLLIVGGRDEHVLELNRDARRRLTAPSQLEVVPGAGHLFEEPGALDEVTRLAADWFRLHLSGT
jgi:putative phosphoribosyl transferase